MLAALPKLGLAGSAKAVRRIPERSAPPPCFKLDPGRPGVVAPL